MISVWPIRQHLAFVMEGAQWDTWGPLPKETLTEKIAAAVRGVLEKSSADEISMKALKAETERVLGAAVNGNSSSWKRARDRGIERATEWTKRSTRSVIREKVEQ